MKTEGETRRKLQQAQYRHVKKILRARFRHLGKGEWPSKEVESIKSDYREFFSVSPVHVIAQQFPDVAALMWVLDYQPDQPLMPNGSLVGRMGGVTLWADSEEEAEQARSMIDKIVEAATSEPELPVLSQELPPVKKSWWQRLFG